MASVLYYVSFLVLIVTFLNPIENNRKLFFECNQLKFHVLHFNKFFNDAFRKFDRYFFLLKKTEQSGILLLLQVLLRSI
jgi:hypothetical protein